MADPGGVAELAALIAFVAERLDEGEQEAALFHEPTCASAPVAGPMECGCRCPARLLEQARLERGVLHGCLRRVGYMESGGTPDAGDVAFAYMSLRVLALRHRRHPLWQQRCGP
ncbi:hypothetical protein [Streptodolium elevatio]